MSDEVSTPLADIGLEANVSAEVSDPAADESAPADPADPAEAADAAAPAESADADEDEESEEEAEVEVNADGFPAVAGELFGGPDANQAVHETSDEGFTADEGDA